MLRYFLFITLYLFSINYADDPGRLPSRCEGILKITHLVIG